MGTCEGSARRTGIILRVSNRRNFIEGLDDKDEAKVGMMMQSRADTTTLWVSRRKCGYQDQNLGACIESYNGGETSQ